MTFNSFQSIVHRHFPDYILSQHGYNGKKNAVAVQFTADGKTYIYSGSYYDIAVKLKVPVISSAIYNSQLDQLKLYETMNGKEDDFGFVNDYTAEIETLKHWFKTISDCDII